MTANKEWWNYRAIVFTKEQCFWVIENLAIFKEGRWPPNPLSYDTGYTEGIQKRRIKHEGYFTKPVEIAAEISVRLKRTGIEGKLLVSEIQAGVTREFLQPESNRALNYIAGFKRKRQSYSQWKADRQRRNHKNIGFAVKI